jgi:hypothetical protein
VWPGGKDAETNRLDSKIDIHLGDNVELKNSWKLDWLAHADQWAQDEVFNFFGGKVGPFLRRFFDGVLIFYFESRRVASVVIYQGNVRSEEYPAYQGCDRGTLQTFPASSR